MINNLDYRGKNKVWERVKKRVTTIKIGGYVKQLPKKNYNNIDFLLYIFLK